MHGEISERKGVDDMAVKYTLNITPEQAREMAMVDIAFLILKAANTSFYFRDLMDEVAKQKGIPADKIKDVIAQLYTEINIDGRFACIGNNTWGLKRWYPVDKMDNSIGTTERPRIINDDDEDDEDLEELAEELEEDFEDDMDEDDMDSIDDPELDADDEELDDEPFDDDEDDENL